MFFWYDYLILCVTLLISVLTGLYFGCFRRKATTTNEYLSGGKKMKILPIALSVTIGHFSTITLIAIPADTYKYGGFWLFSFFMTIIFVSLSIFVYYPVLFKSNASSSFQYLEQRFDRKTKLLGSILYVLYENAVLSIVSYTPALALATVTEINVQLIAFIICGICIFYTAIGGLRTVIWTDLLQFTIIILSFFILCYIGINSVGGVTSVWNRVLEGGRLDIFDFDLNPTKKDSFWISVFGYTPRFLYYICLSQSSVQKYLSLPSYKSCIRSITISGFSWLFVFYSATIFGLIMYANFVNCDPVLAGKIAKNDQIAPYFVEQINDRIPGISGIFMAALVSAGISTLSSSLNALSGVIYNDIIANFIKKDVKENTKVKFLKVIVIIQGLICTSFVFVIPYLGEIIPFVNGITGLIDGPSLGLFTLGIVFPYIQSQDAFCATICTFIFMISIYIPSVYYQLLRPEPFPSKPLNSDNCSNSNFHFTKNTSTLLNTSTDVKPFFLFRLSFTYYCLIGTLLTILLANLLHFIRNKQTCIKTQREENVSMELKQPLKKEEKSLS